MNERYVRNRNNEIIGYVSESGPDLVAYDYNIGYVGRYSSWSDITYDRDGNIYCYGNAAEELVRRSMEGR